MRPPQSRSSLGSPASTPPNSTMPARMSAANSSPSGRRATPTMAKLWAAGPPASRWKSAGSSLRLVRSPDAPKITRIPASGILSLPLGYLRQILRPNAHLYRRHLHSLSFCRQLRADATSSPFTELQNAADFPDRCRSCLGARKPQSFHSDLSQPRATFSCTIVDKQDPFRRSTEDLQRPLVDRWHPACAAPDSTNSAQP
jgi:hypothetical protein